MTFRNHAVTLEIMSLVYASNVHVCMWLGGTGASSQPSHGLLLSSASSARPKDDAQTSWQDVRISQSQQTPATAEQKCVSHRSRGGKRQPREGVNLGEETRWQGRGHTGDLGQ